PLTKPWPQLPPARTSGFSSLIGAVLFPETRHKPLGCGADPWQYGPRLMGNPCGISKLGRRYPALSAAKWAWLIEARIPGWLGGNQAGEWGARRDRMGQLHPCG